MQAFVDTSADNLWRRAFTAVAGDGAASREQRSRAGETLESLHVAFELTDPRQRWVVSRHPVINPAFATAEVIWILAGSNDAATLNYWNRQLPKFAGATPTYPGAYGYRLRRHFGIDQIRRAVEVLTASPDTRQVVLQLWDSTQDLPNGDGSPTTCDIPCNVTSLLKVRNGRLHWTQVMRSHDLMRGFPYNFVQFTTVQELVAGWLGVDLGSYHHWSDSLHVYCSDLNEFTLTAPSASVANSDSLMMPMALAERSIVDLYRRLERFTDQSLTRAEFKELAWSEGLPIGFRSFLAILAAEAARRRSWLDHMLDAEAECSNEQLLRVWQLWKESRTSRSRVTA